MMMGRGGRIIDPRRDRTDNAMGIAAERAQAYLTWGGRQVISFSVVGPAVFAFNPQGQPPMTSPIPGLSSFDQLVDMRYERPTNWSLNLYIEAQQPFFMNEFMDLLWAVNISVGKASNRIAFETRFDQGASIVLQRVLFSQQMAAQTIQVIPTQLEVSLNAGARQQTIAWSSWIAPVVD